MAKYTTQDVKDLAQLMRNAKDEGKPFAILTGSGCSITANIPDAPGLLRKLDESHYGEPLRSRLQRKNLCDCDYGTVMAAMPLDVRKGFLTPLLEQAKVNWGHLALATILKHDFFSHVLTFNFDNVLARAAGICGFYPAIYDFGVNPASRFGHLARKSIIHLHGQGHGAVMKNTAKETEEHAGQLYPLFRHVFENYGLLVNGYSGQSDRVFPQIADAFRNENWLYWCDYEDRPPLSGVNALLQKDGSQATHLRGADFDSLMIDLAQELGTFPPDVLVKPATHLLAEINPIVEAPAHIPVAATIMVDLKNRLLSWQVAESDTSATMKTDLLGGNVAAAQEKGESSTSDDPEIKDMLAWVKITEGVKLFQMARAKGGDEMLYREAISKYEQALAINPDKHEAFNNWGNALGGWARAKGNDETLFREAFSKYQRAVKIKPDYGNAYYNWGTDLSALARAKCNDGMLFREAIHKYELAHKINPDDYEALYNCGVAIYELAKSNNDLGLFSSAAEKFEAALNIKPDLPKALNNWGLTLLEYAKISKEQQFFTSSFPKFEAALKLVPDFDLALYNWGTALSELAAIRKDQELFHEAIEKFEKSAKLNPARHNAFYNWGVALAALAEAKNSDEALLRGAISKYEAALAIKPDKHEALCDWGVALATLAEAKNNDEELYREAISKYGQALTLKPDYHEALDRWAIALSNLYHNSHDKALLGEMEDKARAAETIEGKASYNLACALALQGRGDELKAQLLRCKADGTLPGPDHLDADPDLAAYRDQDWFKALLSKVEG